MDSENTKKETFIKVTDWLRGIWEMRRQAGPVQQWIDSIPTPIKPSFPLKNEHDSESTQRPNISLNPTEPKDILFSTETKQPIMTVSAPINIPNATAINVAGLASSLPHKLARDPSLQSDSSHCSSVESLLELRKADPEAVLLSLGFGGCPTSPQKNCTFSRIPKRFLQPSKLKGIAINDFMKKQQETSESFDSVSLGYRGLTGSPYVAPSEIVQKIMQRLREHESHEHDPHVPYSSSEHSNSQYCNGKLSVLSLDSRQFLERPRSRSPDMRNKRIVIGQQSFAFGNDGDLIEIKPIDVIKSFEANQASNVPDTVEYSGICNNEVDNHNNLNQQVAIQEIKNVLPERLSFENSIGLYTDGFNSTEIPTENSDRHCETLDRIFVEKQDVYSNVTSHGTPDTRRASDGYCNEKIEVLLAGHERRHSDSIIQVAKHDKESVLGRRRKTLKRQSRISDVEAIECYDSKVGTPDPVQNKQLQYDSQEDIHISKRKSISLKSIQDNCEKMKVENKTANQDIIHYKQSSSEEISDHVELVSDCLSKEKLEDSKSSIAMAQSMQSVSGDEDKGITCCHSGTKKYLKKVEKIIQGKKDMVTKGRRDMAEIREMLNSVLSVRLEPGF